MLITYLPTTDVKSVEVAGDFSDWKPVPMAPKDGTYEYLLEGKPGAQYMYKFIVDGQWIIQDGTDTGE